MEDDQLPAHGGVGKEKADVALNAALQRGVVVFKKIDICEPIEPPWQAIKQWIPADDDEPSFHCQDTHHSNESRWKPKECASEMTASSSLLPIEPG